MTMILTQRVSSLLLLRHSKAPRQVAFFSSSRQQQSLSTTRSFTSSSAFPDPFLVDARHAPADFDPSCAVVYRDFITADEADTITQEILSRMKRRRYEKGHWDAVITKYKEIELQDISFPPQDGDAADDEHAIADIFERTRQQLQEHHLDYRPVQWLPCHAIDLKKQGELNAHVDSVRFSGDLVAGLSLLSPSIMRLVPDTGDNEDEVQSEESLGCIDLFLPPQSLYALTGDGRYKYSHQLLPDGSIFTNPLDGSTTKVGRDQRLSIIFRDAKRDEV